MSLSININPPALLYDASNSTADNTLTLELLNNQRVDHPLKHSCGQLNSSSYKNSVPDFTSILSYSHYNY